MTTIKDIAALLNLSPTTISLVLNNRPNKIAENTKKKIIETAKQLHYYPNQLAVGLAKKRTNTIGLILPDISNIFFSELACGVDNEARKHGWNIIFSSSADHYKRDLENIQALYSRGVDAIIIAMASQASAENMEEYNSIINGLAIPFIFVDRYEPTLHCSSVMLNQKKGLYIATKHLLELGHTKISCVTGPLSLHTTKDRLEGYYWAYRDAGLKPDKDSVFQGDFLAASGGNAAEKILKKDFTAILAFNDMMAFGVYKKLNQKKVRIPRDISVVGFDDLFFSEITDPPLTTVRQPASDIGAEAAKRAILEVEENSPKQNIFFDPVLIIRESTKRKEGKE